MEITVAQLVAMLLCLKNATIATIIAHTVPRMRKTDNPYFGRVVKEAVVNGIIGFWNYTLAVDRQRLREELPDNFVAMPRAWGNRIPNSALVEHKGQYYLEIKVQSANCLYRLDNGELIDSAVLQPFFATRGESRQGVEKEIILRDYSLENIRLLKMGGEDYQIIP